METVDNYKELVNADNINDQPYVVNYNKLIRDFGVRRIRDFDVRHIFDKQYLKTPIALLYCSASNILSLEIESSLNDNNVIVFNIPKEFHNLNACVMLAELASKSFHFGQLEMKKRVKHKIDSFINNSLDESD